MKILIGTPVHEAKDYSMEKWIANVSKLEYPADLLMVDNSIGTGYMEKIKAYCDKNGLKYELIHLELPPDQDVYQRVARAREAIRQYILAHGYDAWFSWECDQIIPADALDKLAGIMQRGNYMMVNHNGWLRDIPGTFDSNFGVSLIHRSCLEKYGFILEFGSHPEMPDNYQPSETWYKKRVLMGGGNCAEIDGVVRPIYHLDE